MTAELEKPENSSAAHHRLYGNEIEQVAIAEPLVLVLFDRPRFGIVSHKVIWIKLAPEFYRGSVPSTPLEQV